MHAGRFPAPSPPKIHVDMPVPPLLGYWPVPVKVPTHAGCTGDTQVPVKEGPARFTTVGLTPVGASAAGDGTGK